MDDYKGSGPRYKLVLLIFAVAVFSASIGMLAGIHMSKREDMSGMAETDGIQALYNKGHVES